MQDGWREYIEKNPRFHMAMALEIEKNQAKCLYGGENSACILVESYCLMWGEISENKFREILVELPEPAKYFNLDDRMVAYFERYFGKIDNKYHRFLMNKTLDFNTKELERLAKKLSVEYSVKEIDEDIDAKMKNQGTYAAKLSRIEGEMGFVCLKGDEIVGAIATDLKYSDGVELNIRVNEKERGNGIAKALAATMILACIEKKIFPIWDAANVQSRDLALTLGYEVGTEYDIYSRG